jgi:hypothetical protein
MGRVGWATGCGILGLVVARFAPCEPPSEGVLIVVVAIAVLHIIGENVLKQ